MLYADLLPEHTFKRVYHFAARWLAVECFLGMDCVSAPHITIRGDGLCLAFVRNRKCSLLANTGNPHDSPTDAVVTPVLKQFHPWPWHPAFSQARAPAQKTARWQAMLARILFSGISPEDLHAMEEALARVVREVVHMIAHRR